MILHLLIHLLSQSTILIVIRAVIMMGYGMSEGVVFFLDLSSAG